MTQPATILFQNARVVTMVEGEPDREALVVRGGRIVAVGSLGECQAAAGPGAACEDLGGAVLAPAFVDAHHHFCIGCLDARAPDLAVAAGAPMREVLARLERYVAQAAPGDGWVRAHGYDPVKLREGRAPTRAELDEVAPDRPLLVIAWSLHEGVANSRALEALGWSRATPDPPGGRLGRTRGGELDGLLVERAFFAAESVSRGAVLAGGDDAWLDECEAHGRALLAVGITRVADAAVPPQFDRLYERAASEGRLPVTVHRMRVGGGSLLEPAAPDASVGASAGAGAGGDGASTLPASQGDAHDDIPIAATKLFLDGGERCGMCLTLRQSVTSIAAMLRSGAGSLGMARARAAAASENMRMDRHLHVRQGVLFYAQQELDSIVATAMEQDVQLAQHAIGNEAIAMAVRAIDRAQRAHPGGPTPRLEHVTMVDEQLARHVASVGAIAVVQPGFLRAMGLRMRVVDTGRTLRPFAFRTLLDAGVRLAGSSDWPVGDYRPLAAISAAVTRATGDGGYLHRAEAITAHEAWHAYTAGAAHAVGMGGEAGELRPGAVADLVVLGADPREVDGEAIADIAVERTYRRGALVHTR